MSLAQGVEQEGSESPAGLEEGIDCLMNSTAHVSHLMRPTTMQDNALEQGPLHPQLKQ